MASMTSYLKVTFKGPRPRIFGENKGEGINWGGKFFWGTSPGFHWTPQLCFFGFYATGLELSLPEKRYTKAEKLPIFPRNLDFWFYLDIKAADNI